MMLDILQEYLQFASVCVVILLLCNSMPIGNLFKLTFRDYLALNRAAP